MDGGTRRRWLHAAGLVALAWSGCVSSPYDSAVKDTTRPDADRVLADAPALLPEQPVATTHKTRGQAAEIVPAGGAGTAQVAARIRATVNGQPILDDELREATAQYAGELLSVPEAQRAEAIQKVAERELQRLIERELVMAEAMEKLKHPSLAREAKMLRELAGQEADKRLRDIKASLKLASDEEMKAVLANQGLTVAGIRRQVERNFMMMEYVRNVINPSVSRVGLQQVREYYQEHPEEFTLADRVKWLDIFIDASRFPDAAAARRYAEQVLARARAGEDFAALAQQFDHGDSKLRNGEGLGSQRGEVKPPQVEQVVWSLRPGEVGPLVDMGFGFHIVKVAERDYAGRRPFDVACQQEVRKKLMNIVAEREYKRVLDELKKKATIQVY